MAEDYRYYVNCKGTDYLEGTSERLSDVTSSVLASCALDYDASLDGEGFFNYTCEKMKLAIQKRGGGSCLHVCGINHTFSSRNQLMSGLDHVVKAIVGASAGSSTSESLILGIKSMLEAAANQVDHVNNKDIIIYNNQREQMIYRSTTVKVIWQNGNCLTIIPFLIKVDGTKTAKKLLFFYESEEMSGTLSFKQLAFSFTKGYCLNAVKEFK